MPIDLPMLRSMYTCFNMNHPEDCCIWSAILTCFFGLLRISNVTVKCQTTWDQHKIVKRSHFNLCNKGCILKVSWSKTIQHQERTLEVPLPFIAGDCICPTEALLHLLSITTDVPSYMPLFSFKQTHKFIPLTQDMIRRHLKRIFPNKHYFSHSLRRGGATWLLVAGVSVDMVKAIGDWKSDCVQKYIKPSTRDKFVVMSQALSNHIS